MSAALAPEPIYPPAEAVERFLSQVDRSGGPGACHPWTGGANWSRYGLLKVDGSMIGASRFALALKLGRKLGRKEVTRHSSECTTTLCCNPDHLSPGTYRDNSRDAAEAGHSLKGKPRPTTLTEQQALEVRRRYASGEGARAVSSATGIAVNSIFNIVTCRTWGHLGPPVGRRAQRHQAGAQ